MRDHDLAAYQKFFPAWADKIRHRVRSIYTLSADSPQIDLLKSLFPEAIIKNLTIKDWDLNRPASEKTDLICAMNVFMYSQKPSLWFGHVMDAARFVWIQDLILGCRNHPHEISPNETSDGDCMRYSKGSYRARLKNAFDLDVFEEDTLEFETYSAGMCHGGCTNLSFLISLRGRVEL